MSVSTLSANSATQTERDNSNEHLFTESTDSLTIERMRIAEIVNERLSSRSEKHLYRMYPKHTYLITSLLRDTLRGTHSLAFTHLLGSGTGIDTDSPNSPNSGNSRKHCAKLLVINIMVNSYML